MKTKERLKLVQELLEEYDNDTNYGVSSISILKLIALKQSFEDELKFDEYMEKQFGKDLEYDTEA